MDRTFRKIKTSELELARSLVKLTFPKLKYVGRLQIVGDKVLYFGHFKLSMAFPKDHEAIYNISTVQYDGRWAYQVDLHQFTNGDWSNPLIQTRWVHPDTFEMYNDPQILKDEYRTLPYLYELKERHPE